MASTPKFASEARIGIGAISSANTNRDGTGTIVDVLVGVAANTRVERVIVQAIGTTTAGMVRLFLHNGTAWFLYREIPIVAITPSATVTAFRDEVLTPDLIPPSTSWKLGAAPHNAESFNVIALGGDLT